MPFLLKLWAAVSIAVAYTGIRLGVDQVKEIGQDKAPKFYNAVSCTVHPVNCVNGFIVYHNQLNPFSQSILRELKRSYVDIGNDWDNAQSFQEKMEKELKNKSDL